MTLLKWVGRCPECQEWGSVAELAPVGTGALPAGAVSAPALPLTELAGDGARVRSTGIAELDRVLGGGLVDGGVLLMAGEPGVGKSTLLLAVASAMGAAGSPVLVVSGEESAAQVRLRAQRVGALSPHVFLAAETSLSAVLGHVETVRPGVLVVDSVQAFAHPDVDGSPGSVAQVRECAAVLVRTAKTLGLAVVLVGHVTKDGSIAGPRMLEHLVDVVVSVEGDRHGRLRMVRAVKNRYGPTEEVGCFELTEAGLVELPDPSGLFLSDAQARAGVTGTCVTVTLEGRRPLVVEVQALVAPAGNAATPRRAVSGMDSARSAMLLAVLSRRAGIPLASCEVYLATVGGVRLTETSADLAAALAVASSASDLALPSDLVACGEVGLAGELRQVRGISRRLAEAARLGFRTALVPRGATDCPPAMRVIEVADVPSALAAARRLAGESVRCATARLAAVAD
jgi:DNA repair protein RadA/Sms